MAVAVLALQHQRPSLAGPVAQPSAAVRLHAGWNLVAAPPGSALPPGTAARYTQPARLASYAMVPVDTGDDFMSGWGYWLYEDADVDLSLAPGVPAFSVIVPARQWVLVGNPSGTGIAAITGADVAYTYSSEHGYIAATSLQPGEAAWVYASAAATVRLSTGPLQTVTASYAPNSSR